MKEPLKHLLIRGKFRVWCRPRYEVGALNVTMFPSQATCVNCLTRFRYATGKGGKFRVKWTSRHEPLEQTPKLEE